MPTAHDLVTRLRPIGRDGARRILRAAFAKLSTLEQAALAMDADFWRKPEKPSPVTP